MLCSVPVGKSAGGSNWLSRIRSIKGFPAGDDDDLGHFLTQNLNSSASESTRPDPQRIAVPNRPEAPGRIRGRVEPEWVGAMDTVLSELFFMGGAGEISSSRHSGKRISRKQTNPKICAASASNNNNNNNSGNSNSSGVVEQKKKGSDFAPKTASLSSDSGNNSTREGHGNVDVDFDVDDEDEDEKELKGYSRSEVTVIDTSCGSWKSEKLVFRRKSVWRVREKKGKLRNFGRKKRKLAIDDHDDHHHVMSLASSDHHQSLIMPSSDEGQNLKNDSREENCKGTANNLNITREEVSTDSPNNLGEDLKKRSQVSGSLKKVKKGGSSVVLIKGVPTDKKSAVKLSKNCPKNTQTKQDLKRLNATPNCL